MKHLKRYDELQNSKIDESLKDWIIAGALSLVSLSSKGQKVDSLMGKANLGEWTQVKKAISPDTLSIDFGSQFESGKHNFSKAKAEETKKKLVQIADFCKKNAGKEIVIKIIASESLVPNVDAETGERLPKGALANIRAEETEDTITTFLDKSIEKNLLKISYEVETQIGKTEYVYGEYPRQSKFTKDQWVKVIIYNKGAKELSTEKYDAYGIFSERFYLGHKAIGDIFLKTRETQDLKKHGGKVYGYQDVLLRTLSPEMVTAEGKPKYDGNLYLIPADWLNGAEGPDGYKKSSNTISLSKEDMEYIKKHFKVSK